MSAPQFTPGPWQTRESRDASGDIAIVAPAGIVAECFMAIRAPNEVGSSEVHSNARLIAAAPLLYEAAAKHLEWIEKEHQGPQYGELTRDTHPLGEQIWSQWWNEQLDLCAETERLCRAALAKARGEQ